jgi:hypothetical protein
VIILRVYTNTNTRMLIGDGTGYSLSLASQSNTLTNDVFTVTDQGNVDIGMLNAMLNLPEDCKFDSLGNLYVADLSNYRIRKITPGGIVTTFLGNGINSNITGTGTSASIWTTGGSGNTFPLAITDTAGVGTLYVATAGNAIYQVTLPGGVMTLLAGTSGTAGSNDATGAAATFNRPLAMTFDSGNLYVAETGNIDIRRINTATGVVTTLSTTGFSANPATKPSLGVITGLVYNEAVSNGTIYYTNNSTGVNSISNVNTASVSAPNVIAATGFTEAYGIVFNSNKTSLFVSDKALGPPPSLAVRRVDITGGAVTLIAGGTVSGSLDATGSNATFTRPRHFAIDSTFSNLYIADGSHKIRKIEIATCNVTTYAGTGVAGYQDGGIPTVTNVNNTLTATTISNASTTSNYIGGSTLSNSILTVGAATTGSTTSGSVNVSGGYFVNGVAFTGGGGGGTISGTYTSGTVLLATGTSTGLQGSANMSFSGTLLDVNGGAVIRNGFRPSYSLVSSGTSITVASSSYGYHYNITTSGITGITLPTGITSTDSNAYWVFRNNTSGYLSITFTYQTAGTTPTNPVAIPPSNAVTMMVTYPSSSLVYVLF